MSASLRYGNCCKENCLRTGKYAHKASGQTRFFEYCINRGCGYKSRAWYYKPGESFPTVVEEESHEPIS